MCNCLTSYIVVILVYEYNLLHILRKILTSHECLLKSFKDLSSKVRMVGCLNPGRDRSKS